MDSLKKRQAYQAMWNEVESPRTKPPVTRNTYTPVTKHKTRWKLLGDIYLYAVATITLIYILDQYGYIEKLLKYILTYIK